MKKTLIAAGSLVAVGLLAVGGSIGINSITGRAFPEPAPTVAVRNVSPEVTKPTPTATPTPTPTPEPVVEAAPIVEAPAAPAPAAPPVPAGPDLCPPGTQSNGSDGYNDTSCGPDICWTMPIPDPAHPECDYFYPPSYYR